LTLRPKPLRSLLLAGMASVAALAFTPASHATAYVLTYDPDYPPIPGLAWRATATLFIPDLCSAAVGTQTLNGGSALLPPQNTFSAVADCAGIELRDTVLFLHQSGNPLNVYDQLNIGDYLADTDGDSSPGFDIETQELFQVDFVAGEAVDFRTSMSLRLAAPTVDAVFAPVASYFMLSLGATPAGVSLCNLEAAPQPPAVGCTAASTYVGTGDPTLQITITRIPEPGSLALALGALGAAAFSRRRRAAPPAHASLPG
jgi:hypothetical protein